MNALQQENYFLKAGIETAQFELQNISQLFAIIHNHDLQKEERAALLWTMWTSTEQALENLKDVMEGDYETF